MTRRQTSQLPLLLELVAGALGAGWPLSTCLQLVAATCDDVYSPALRRVGGLICLGATSEYAWRSACELLPPAAGYAAENAAFETMRRLATRGHTSGTAIAANLVEIAEEIRRSRCANAAARAQRAALWGMLPLATCFLPSFVCIGIGPVLIGLAGHFAGQLS